MNPRQILIPIDVAHCPREVFSFANSLAAQDVTITLLHVVASNLSSTIGASEDRGHETRLCLQRLERKFLSPRLDSRVCIRAGTPAEEILAEAKQIGGNLIVLAGLAGLAGSPGKAPPTISKAVIQRAACEVILLQVTKRFDCKEQQIWSTNTAEMKAPKAASWRQNFQTLPKSARRFLTHLRAGGVLSWMLPAFLLSPLWRIAV